MFKVKQDFEFSSESWGCKRTVPAGTRLVELKDGMGRACYAVADRATTAAITGDDHRAKYYYLYVPADIVEEVK